MSRKIWTVLTVVLVVALIAATFVGCKDKNNGNDKTNAADYTVTLDYNYQGATATTLTVADGDAISEALLTNPTRTGYTFGGWYLDAGCQTPLTFDNGMSLVEVTTDITLYAKWVQEISLAAISAEYVGAAKSVGDAITAADFRVTATYTDGTTKVVTGVRLGATTVEKVGANVITLTYVENGVTKTATATVEGKAQSGENEPTLVGITAEYRGADLEVGTDVAKADVVVTASYSDRTTKSVTDFTLGVYDKTTAGTKTVTVTYEGKTATFQVTYVEQETPGEPTLVGIEAEYKGANLEVGTEVAKSDVTVTASYSDESTKSVTDFTLGTYDKTTAGTKTITVTYEDKTATFQVTYVEPSVQTRVPVYFYNGNGWDTVNAYGFDLAGGKHLGEWGGAGMTNEEDGWFSVLAPAGTYYIIFNNGAAQSRIYAFEGETVYYAGGVAYASKEAFDNTRVTYATEVGVTAYDMALEEGQYVAKGVDIDEDRATDVRVFVNDSTVQCVGYESKAGIYNIYLKYENEQWTAWFVDVTETPAWEASAETRTVYFTNNQNDEAVYAYVWVGEGDDKHELTAWNDREAAKYEYTNDYSQKVYSYTFSVSYTNVVFTFGEEQTVDIALTDLEGDNNAYYIAGDSAGESGWAVGQWKYVVPTPKTLVSIAAEYTGSEVTVGKSVSKDDITVTATYSDESTAAVTDFTIGDYDNTAAGNVIITITYQEKTDTITVTFVEEEEEWTASETTRTIYFTKPNDWAKACAYVWAVDGKGETHAEAAWGTKQMTYVEDNQYGEKIYSYTFSVSYTCIIFLNGNEGNANQTVNIDLTEIGEGNDQYYLTAQVAEEGADQGKWLAADTKYVAYVPKTLDHITAVYGGEDIEVDGEIALSDVTVTAFYSDETSEVVTEDITLDYDSSEVAENVTVTVTYGGKTTTFKINVVAATPEWTPSETTRTIYFTNNKGWSNLKAYIYCGIAGEQLSAWPGEDMEYVTENEMGEAVYSVTFSVSYDTIVFNSGDVQTVDVALSDLEGDNNAYYIAGDSANDAGKWAVGQWKYVAPAPKTLVSIAAKYNGTEVTVGKSVSKDDIAVTATYSDESTAAVTDFAIGDYDNTAAGNVIITITYQEKTDTITVAFVEEEEELTRTVYFTDNFKWGSANGGKIYAYVFKGKTPYKDWPGELMTYVENNTDEDAVYGYTFSTEYDTIIFSNGDGTQTIDITLGEDNAYYCSGWSDGSVTVGTWNRA